MEQNIKAMKKRIKNAVDGVKKNSTLIGVIATVASVATSGLAVGIYIGLASAGAVMVAAKVFKKKKKKK